MREKVDKEECGVEAPPLRLLDCPGGGAASRKPSPSPLGGETKRRTTGGGGGGRTTGSGGGGGGGRRKGERGTGNAAIFIGFGVQQQEVFAAALFFFSFFALPSHEARKNNIIRNELNHFFPIKITHGLYPPLSLKK
uniref:Uncharacterized protein n=1 Tax=Oryza meridionalis TaxID=40149 RepID=A0A0E0D9V0_9ORYZ